MLNCNIDKLPIAIYDSNVVFGNPLPIVFEISNTSFPTNESAGYAITSIVDSGGYARVAIAGTAGFNCGDYVTIDSELYQGVYRIIETFSVTDFTIDAPYQTATSASGTVKQYYNNYYIEARVYAGIPDSHYYNTDNPMRLVATLRNTPRFDLETSTNLAYIDVSGAVRSAFLQIENDVCSQTEEGNNYLNDRRAWVAFYIEYREVYDIGNDCDVVQFEGAWEQSEVFYAINGTTQFQYKYANNAGEYVLNENDLELPTKFMTTLENPILWKGKELDLALFIPSEAVASGNTVEFVVSPNVGTADYTEFLDISLGEGVYRILLGDIVQSEFTGVSYVDVYVKLNGYRCTEFKRITITDKCTTYTGKHLTYLNTLGGWDYLFFGDGQDVVHDTEETQEIKRNIFTKWANNFTGGTTQFDAVRRMARKGGTLRTMFLPKELRKQYSEQLASTVKIQEVIELPENESCLEVANRRTLIIDNSNFGYADSDQQTTITLDYKETNEKFSQWQ
jgi:hypothetical protein